MGSEVVRASNVCTKVPKVHILPNTFFNELNLRLSGL